MFTPQKAVELVNTIEYLIKNKDESQAYEIIRQNPSIFSHLTENMRDDRKIALVAMERNLQTGNNASQRLKKDITFFVEAFNLYYSRPPISLTTVRDMAFMLEFAKQYFNFRHEISEIELTVQFRCLPHETEEQINEAALLINKVNNYEDWLSKNKENDIAILKNAHKYFSPFVFEYAFMWAYGTMSWRRTLDHGIW